ncbi:etoposide-induced protein 2.4-domain-containing protein [Pisolithus croceorrhizus]|nr:etoposide-induced protein 2.4-domain-containing protein [Pisolithus croceorrhizus]KAI6131867.1 etoposide-induced protein 2.4-domain-containing protein [Pisolithus croceorrhizus]KAI6162517.1 etoposide-induced protein 2.4-domain-containing protein [Pisolithus thermaeus]
MSRQVPYEYTRHLHSSSRAAYPSFLSLYETIWIHIRCLLRGLFDAFRWDLVVPTRALRSDPEVRSNFLKSILLNSLSLASIYAFDLLLQPLVHDHPSWLRRNVGWCYQVLWLLPVVGISFYLNSSWCNTIAKRTFILQYGNRAVQPRYVTYTGMLNTLAASAYRTVMVVTSVIVSLGFGMIPHAGPFLSFAFMCWIDAFVWVARGLSLASRVKHLEERWAYYFAFGLPSAAICTWGSGLANAALFALLFPAYIIMAMTARPAPQDPYNPLSSSDTVRYLSPLIPLRLPIFAIVIWLNDFIVHILSITGTAGQVKRHHRALSHSPENAEEGAGMDTPKLANNVSRRLRHSNELRSPVERTRAHRREPPTDKRKRG